SVSLLEFHTSGTSQSSVNTIAINSTPAATGNAALTQSGSATSEGYLTLSQDGHYLLLTGYNASTGTTGIAGSSVDRIVGRVDAGGTVDTTTRAPGYSANNIRSASSADGSSIYVAGPGGLTQLAFGTQPTTANSINSANVRMVLVAGSNLYASGSTTG